MKPGDVLQRASWTPVVFLSSGSALPAGLSFCDTGAQRVVTVEPPATSFPTASNLTWRSHWQTNRTQRCQWVASAPTVSIAPMPALVAPEPSEIPALPPTTPAKAPINERIELAIDSLHSYDLVKPIPVLIESLGDKVFLAEVPALNLTTTGSSIGSVFLLLKEHIITTYEGLRSKKSPDAEQVQQLRAFDQYIGKPRRHWF
jgi:hypothetical protein